MSQSGYTPIQIYSSSTTGNTPSASNLTNSTLGSELAINITDGKLFYKDNSNTVQVIGWKTTPISAGGTGATTSTGALTNLGASPLAGSTSLTTLGTITTGTWNGSTIGVPYGGTGLTSLTSGYIPYGNGTSAFSSNSSLYFDGSNLGIGTTSPTSIANYHSLTMNGTTGVLFDLKSNGTTYGRIQTDTTFALALWTATANPMVFGTNYTQAMQIGATGGVSIGNTTDPGATNLSVTGNILSGTTSTSGSMSNSKIIVGGNFRTYTSSGTLSGSPTANTIATVTAAGLYIVHCYIPGYGAGPSNWSNYCIVSATGSSTLAVVAQGTNTNVVFSVSGSNIQVVQQSSAISFTWSILQIA